MQNPRAAKSAVCSRRDVLYITSSGKRSGSDVASCCLDGPKRLLLFVIERR